MASRDNERKSRTHTVFVSVCLSSNYVMSIMHRSPEGGNRPSYVRTTQSPDDELLAVDSFYQRENYIHVHLRISAP